MKRARTLSIAAVVAALALAVGVSAPANAAPGDAQVQVQVTYKSSPSATPQKLSPNTEVEVSFWKYDDATGYYYQQADGVWTEGGPDTVDTSEPLEPGTYSIRFLAYDQSIGGQWWEGARYFAERTDVVLTADQTLNLGTVVLTPRTFDVGRISGADRYATAVSISQATIPDGYIAPVVYLVDGTNYPDALAAGPAAIIQGGVLLLTKPGSLPGSTRDELVRLQPQRVVIVGGTGAVSNTVKSAVQSALPGVPVARLGGATRYETAALVVRDAFTAGDANIAVLATGRDYPDALAAGPAAGYMGSPLIVMDGKASTLPAATEKLLKDLKVQAVLVVGGTGAVSAGTEKRLKTLYGADYVFRAQGVNRYATAEALNEAVFAPVDDVFLASGANFPDALAGAPLAGALQAPLLLTKPGCLSTEAHEGIMSSRANGVTLLGGTGALSSTVENLTVCG